MTTLKDFSLSEDDFQRYPHFHRPGLNFVDINPLFRETEKFKQTITTIADHLKEKHGDNIEILALVDAKGFVVGAAVALEMGLPFVLLRKGEKLPGSLLSVSYVYNYGKSLLEAQDDAIKPGQKVVIIDDVVGSGGTMEAACNLVRKMEGNILEAACVIELPSLNGRAKFGDVPLFSVVQLGKPELEKEL
ncbi:Phosphoribosyl transferase domain containing protein [Theileria equi strain WA]|uniref:adenine phosphoribosyltransferase n=1 Tax=Theileria equi strain WA TaxID=1537102 RepID=L0ATG8_THEEQ|nr:Phosphoribosyl transferase domain containing protein [Theileria equi strain WA]AFZ78932.1 Phosphoribosyl transferase domain containing protein [Theileria equi strain WA]|eukprot:XP_004828598.1 Phosphoribosyl transferase domain containing protein [Theileria equi strain WA]